MDKFDLLELIQRIEKRDVKSVDILPLLRLPYVLRFTFIATTPHLLDPFMCY